MLKNKIIFTLNIFENKKVEKSQTILGEYRISLNRKMHAQKISY